MQEICDDIRENVSEVIAEWERLVREEPWYCLPPQHRVDNLPAVISGLVESSLCTPYDRAAHRRSVDAAADHGTSRRRQGVPDHVVPTEFHLLRQALWYYLDRKFRHTGQAADAIIRIDAAISLATNASMWGYHRDEIEAQGKWEEGMERIVSSSRTLRTHQKEGR